jgi:hypothetical protein
LQIDDCIFVTNLILSIQFFLVWPVIFDPDQLVELAAKLSPAILQTSGRS